MSHVILDVHDRCVIARIRDEGAHKDRKHGEHPENAARCELQKAFHRRVRSTVESLRQRVEYAAEHALKADDGQEIGLESRVVPQRAAHERLHECGAETVERDAAKVAQETRHVTIVGLLMH